MKRLFVVLLAALTLTSCGEKRVRLSAEQTVVECWTRISNGDYVGATELMEATEQEKIGYQTMLAEAYQPKLEKVGGITRVDILVSHEEGDTALVQALLVLGDGSEIEETHALKRVDKVWLLQAL